MKLHLTCTDQHLAPLYTWEGHLPLTTSSGLSWSTPPTSRPNMTLFSNGYFIMCAWKKPQESPLQLKAKVTMALIMRLSAALRSKAIRSKAIVKHEA